MLNADIIQGKWNEVKGRLKQKWGKLTDDDIAQIKGSYDELSGRLQERYGFQKAQAEIEIKNFLQKNGWMDNE